jgi:hypothetical protein
VEWTMEAFVCVNECFGSCAIKAGDV